MDPVTIQIDGIDVQFPTKQDADVIEQALARRDEAIAATRARRAAVEAEIAAAEIDHRKAKDELAAAGVRFEAHVQGLIALDDPSKCAKA